jgi:hypothetical protein
MKLNALPMYAVAVAGLAAAPSALACDSCTTNASNQNVCYWSGTYGYASCWSGSNGSGISACYASGDCGYGPGGGYGGGGYGGGGGGPFFCGSNGCLS